MHDTLVGGRLELFQAVDATHPMRIQANFVARDTSLRFHSRDLPVTDCPFVLTLLRRADSRVAWRSDRAASRIACPTIERDQGSARYTTWDVPALLGDSLQNGWYRATLDVRAVDGRVFHYRDGPFYLDKSREPPEIDYSALEYRASTSIEDGAPRNLKTRVVAKNTSSKSVQLDYGACAVAVRLFRNASRTGPPIWRSELRKPPGVSGGYACTAQLIISVVPPGDSLVFRSSAPMYEVIGDSLPSAHYFVSADLSLVGPRHGADPSRDVKTSLPAGEVDIAPRTERLPSTRGIDGLTFAASTRVASDMIRTSVRVTNTSDHEISNTIMPSCPVVVYGYRSEALRDSVPIVNPAISLSNRCSGYGQQFTLAPGQSWMFEMSTAVSELRSRYGSGHYWFTAWPQTTTNLLLAAGDVIVP